MNECGKCRDMLQEALYGNLDPEARGWFEGHLGRCEECRREYEALRSAIEVMERHIRPEPDGSFWEGYWDRLRIRMSSARLFEPRPRRGFTAKLSAFTPPAWALQAAAAALLVLIGIFIGRLVWAPAPVRIQSAHTLEEDRGPALPELASRTRSYVQRSKLILLAVANFNPEVEDPYSLDLVYQKKISQDLVREADWLKRRLGEARQRRLQELVEDLDAVLLQVANLDPDETAALVELVQTGFQSRGILLKLHLAEMNRPWERLGAGGPEAKNGSEL